MKVYKKIILFIVCFTLTGCFNYTEINNLIIVNAIGIDVVDNEYLVTVQVINPIKSNSNEYYLESYSKTGNTLSNALDKISDSLGNKLYLSHLEALFINKEVIEKQGFLFIDYFVRTNNINKEFLMFSTEKKALDIIKSKINIKELKNSNTVLNITFENLLNRYVNNNIDIYLPILEYTDNKESVSNTDSKELFTVDNAFVFADAKIVGIISKEDLLNINILKNKHIKINKTIKYNDDYISFYIDIPSIKATSTLEQDIFNINYKIDGEAKITEYLGNTLNDEDYQNIIKSLNENINNSIQSSVNKLNTEYNSDIFGFKEYLYKNHPNTNYNQINIKIQSNIKLIEQDIFNRF